MGLGAGLQWGGLCEVLLIHELVWVGWVRFKCIASTCES
jgi:hypothetical protein